MSIWTEHRMRRLALPWLALAAALLCAPGCRQDMHDQPNYSAFEPSEFFADGTSSRLPLEGTVARGQLREDTHLYSGRDGADFAREFPFEITPGDLDRGQERYDIYCSPCHDRTGGGNGMIMQRGFLRKSPSFHDDRLRSAPVGYLFDVITNGYGAMLDYRSQITVEDRWRIVAYLRALQLARQAAPQDVPPDQREFLTTSVAAEPE